MSELTDLEKLKQEVQNLKRYLQQDIRVLGDLYSDMQGIDWEECRKYLNIYNSIKFATFHDLIRDIDNDDYNSFSIGDIGHINKMEQLVNKIYREKGRERREIYNMSQQDIPVKKGGKTRKNRKPRK